MHSLCLFVSVSLCVSLCRFVSFSLLSLFFLSLSLFLSPFLGAWYSPCRSGCVGKRAVVDVSRGRLCLFSLFLSLSIPSLILLALIFFLQVRMGKRVEKRESQ